MTICLRFALFPQWRTELWMIQLFKRNRLIHTYHTVSFKPRYLIHTHITKYALLLITFLKFDFRPRSRHVSKQLFHLQLNLTPRVMRESSRLFLFGAWVRRVDLRLVFVILTRFLTAPFSLNSIFIRISIQTESPDPRVPIRFPMNSTQLFQSRIPLESLMLPDLWPRRFSPRIMSLKSVFLDWLNEKL
jgi:hypothetical protein